MQLLLGERKVPPRGVHGSTLNFFSLISTFQNIPVALVNAIVHQSQLRSEDQKKPNPQLSSAILCLVLTEEKDETHDWYQKRKTIRQKATPRLLVKAEEAVRIFNDMQKEGVKEPFLGFTRCLCNRPIIASSIAWWIASPERTAIIVLTCW